MIIFTTIAQLSLFYSFWNFYDSHSYLYLSLVACKYLAFTLATDSGYSSTYLAISVCVLICEPECVCLYILRCGSFRTVTRAWAWFAAIGAFRSRAVLTLSLAALSFFRSLFLVMMSIYSLCLIMK